MSPPRPARPPAIAPPPPPYQELTVTRPCLLLTVLLLALATGAGAVPLTPGLELNVFDG